MGVVEKSKRKKKKGRPSLLDLQKRSLKQQQLLLNKHYKNKLKSQLLLNSTISSNINNTNTKPNPNPNPNPTPSPPNSSSSTAVVRRSTRRNPNPSSNSNSNSDEGRTNKGEKKINKKKSKKKKKRKLKRVHKLSDDEEEEDEDDDGGEFEEDGEQEREISGGGGVDDDSTLEGNNQGRSLRKRKIDSISRGSTTPIADDDKGISQLEIEKQSIPAINQTNSQQGCEQDDGPTTPLPDKKLLLFILDRLQKKDTYGVFAEPVDPEELPDYFEVIQHPMDFSTVRKKLDDCKYGSLDQFEKDVFLICSNAMQYNAPDTIYFRQARSILELANKNFENLRQDSDDNEPDPEPKVVRRGRPPTKHLKRPPGRPPLVRANSDFSEATTPVRTVNQANKELRKGPSPSEKYGSAGSLARSLYGSHSSEAYIGRSAERYERCDDLTGSASKGISMKHGKKIIVLDEKRTSYKHPYALACGHEPSVLTTFQGERKQLIAVGIHTEYGYARSLARFAAKLGPVAWKVASRRIERCLPSGTKFGPGWIGENDRPAERPLQDLPNTSGQSFAPATMPASADASSAPTQTLVKPTVDTSEQKPQGEQSSGTQTPADHPTLDNESSKPIPPSADSASVSSASLPSGSAGANLTPEPIARSGPSSDKISSSTRPIIKSEKPIQIDQQTSSTQSRINGVNGTYGLNFAAQMGKMIGAGRPTIFNVQSSPSIVTVSRTESQSPPSADNNGCGGAKVPANSSTTKAGDCSPKKPPYQEAGSAPPDLNVGFQSPGSPSSGKADSMQPDLALQL